MMQQPTFLDGERLARHERYGIRGGPTETRRSLSDAMGRARVESERRRTLRARLGGAWAALWAMGRR